MEINWDSVFDVIEAQSIPDWDKELVGAAVARAAEKWVERDRRVEVVAVEEYGEDPVRYRIDLVLRTPEGLTVVDWKAKRGGGKEPALSDRWATREARSMQSRIYAAALATKYGSRVFPVRCEIRGVTLEEEPKVRTVELVIPRREAVEAVRWVRGVRAMRNVMVKAGRVPWVKDDAGCRCFGPKYPCEFEGVCWGGERAPEHEEEKVTAEMSYSTARDFLRCPERYRLLRVMGEAEDREEITGPGKAFHAAMAEVYQQLGNGVTDPRV